MRRSVVIGRGLIPARLFFIGEAPGRSEDLLGEPFVGRSGQLLDRMLDEAGIIGGYYITNCVRCRPCTSEGENREPTGDEVLACMNNVLTLAKCVRPEIVIFVGKVAEYYYRKHFAVTATILHPSFVLRKGGEASPWFLHNIQILRRVNYASKSAGQLFA